MTDNVINLDKQRPHLVIGDLEGNQHVIPVSFLEDVAVGATSLTELDGFESVVPTIVGEWLRDRGFSSE